MPDGEDFYLTPIELGYFRYPDLLDGSIHIEHIADCNDHIAVNMENRARLRPQTDG